MDISPDITTDRGSVLVQIAKLVQLPKAVIPVGCPSIVWLKLFDDGHGFAWHIPDDSPKPILQFRGPLGKDGEHYLPRRLGISEQGELPCQLIEPGAQRIDSIREAVGNIQGHSGKLNPANMATIHQIVLFGDSISLLPAIGDLHRVESLEVLVRPSYFCAKIIEPVLKFEGGHPVEPSTLV